jgi:hypothetical protein
VVNLRLLMKVPTKVSDPSQPAPATPPVDPDFLLKVSRELGAGASRVMVLLRELSKLGRNGSETAPQAAAQAVRDVFPLLKLRSKP